jgi:hypothetical protein
LETSRTVDGPSAFRINLKLIFNPSSSSKELDRSVGDFMRLVRSSVCSSSSGETGLVEKPSRTERLFVAGRASFNPDQRSSPCRRKQFPAADVAPTPDERGFHRLSWSAAKTAALDVFRISSLV